MKFEQLVYTEHLNFHTHSIFINYCLAHFYSKKFLKMKWSSRRRILESE